MINFRFHIVSLTAVLLALGIGLVLGTAFFDDATVSLLRSQLDDLTGELDAAETQNAELHDQLESLTTEDDELDEQLGERVLSDQLVNDPVLVIKPQGLEDNPEDRALDALSQAGADVRGMWRLTDRFALDDDDEVADLAEALDLATDDVGRLRENLSQQLADVVRSVTDAPATTPSTQPEEPELLTRLHEAGFVDYELPEGSDDNAVLLPADNLRVLVLTGKGAQPSDSLVLEPMVTRLAADSSVPVVVAMPVFRVEEGEDDPPTPLATTIREDDVLSERVSTIDDLDRVAGRVATVLALEDAMPGRPVIGHYGLGEGAQRLLPPQEGG